MTKRVLQGQAFRGLSLEFLLPPGEEVDWRMVLLVDAALHNRLPAAIPGSVTQPLERWPEWLLLATPAP